MQRTHNRTGKPSCKRKTRVIYSLNQFLKSLIRKLQPVVVEVQKQAQTVESLIKLIHGCIDITVATNKDIGTKLDAAHQQCVELLILLNDVTCSILECTNTKFTKFKKDANEIANNRVGSMEESLHLVEEYKSQLDAALKVRLFC